MQNEIHLKNAKTAASAAPDYQSYSAWVASGANPDDELEVEAIAIAYLPPECFELLAAIAAASNNSDGFARREERTQYALAQPADAVARLVVLLEKAKAELEDQREGGAPPAGGAFGPVPPPPRDDDGYKP